ncbi:unannotated protein [freshwater metagenome]|uniref:Unannotated protein n=1 Tax=freshwater metagenome TaxID=449393 RepID=A0A6J6XGZ0_9ZZZZ
MLLLIDLIGLNLCVRSTEPVNGHPYLEKMRTVRGAHYLRPHDSGIRSHCLINHDLERVPIENSIAVAEKQERCTLDAGNNFIGCSSKTRRTLTAPNKRTRCNLSYPRGGVIARPVIDHERCHIWVIERIKSEEGLFKPLPCIADDNHSDHRWPMSSLL